MPKNLEQRITALKAALEPPKPKHKPIIPIVVTWHVYGEPEPPPEPGVKVVTWEDCENEEPDEPANS